MKKKLILGTANFGLNYGIANGKQLDEQTVLEILTLADEQGIGRIDTAGAYGDAEIRLGRYFKQRGKRFKLITKLPEREYASEYDVEKEIVSALERLEIGSIDTLLIHSFKAYRKDGDKIVPVLQRLCREKVIGQYGFSVYRPDEMKRIADEATEAVAIEFPVNLFDQRFIGGAQLQELKERGFTLLGRSVFLQGLFFLEAGLLNHHFLKVKSKIERLGEISNKAGLGREEIALLFVLTNTWIDGVVMGVDCPEQLKRNIAAVSDGRLESYKNIEPLLPSLGVEDERITIPSNWPAETVMNRVSLL